MSLSQGLNENRHLDFWYSPLYPSGRCHLLRNASLLCAFPCSANPDRHPFHYPDPDGLGQRVDFDSFSNTNACTVIYAGFHKHPIQPGHAYPDSHSQPDSNANAYPDQDADENCHAWQYTGKHLHPHSQPDIHANPYSHQYSQLNADAYAHCHSHGNEYPHGHPERDAHPIWHPHRYADGDLHSERHADRNANGNSK